MHGHERRPAREADRQEDRHQRQRRHQDRSRLLVQGQQRQRHGVRGRRPERPHRRRRQLLGHRARSRRLHHQLRQLRQPRTRERRNRHLHDHQQRPARKADRQEDRHQRQRRHQDRGRLLVQGQQRQRHGVRGRRPERPHRQRRQLLGQRARSRRLHHQLRQLRQPRARQRRDQDLHDHQQRPARQADRQEDRHQRQRRHQDRSRLLASRSTAALRPAFEADGQNDLTVNAGSYSVSEPAAAGYTTSYDNCDNLAIANGATATCTITNNDQPAKLIVIKQVVNDNGGKAVSSDFTLSVAATNPTPASFKGADAPGVEVSVAPGAYAVTETGGPTGYTGSFSADCAGSIALGQTKTCTVTNDDQPAKLIVKKIVINDNGGSKTAADFTLHGQRRQRDRVRGGRPERPHRRRRQLLGQRACSRPATPPATTTATTWQSPTAPPPPARSPTTTSPRS